VAVGEIIVWEEATARRSELLRCNKDSIRALPLPTGRRALL